MKITKFKNGNLNLKLEPEYDKFGDEYTLDEILNNHDMFMNDLYFKVDGAGVLWIIDFNKNLAYDIPMINCGFILFMFNPNYWASYNFFKDLLDGKTVKLVPYGTIDEVREFFHEDAI